MPIYGYACQHCGHTLDALQKMADEPLLDCPECEQPRLKRQLSAPRFRLKGQGWYETDFKKDNQRNLAGEKEAAKTDAKSDSKADTKADTKANGKSAQKAEKKSATKSTTGSSAKSSGDKASAA